MLASNFTGTYLIVHIQQSQNVCGNRGTVRKCRRKFDGPVNRFCDKGMTGGQVIRQVSGGRYERDMENGSPSCMHIRW